MDSNVDCPYRLEVPKGQKLNLTLLDFSLPPKNNTDGEQTMAKFCEQVRFVLPNNIFNLSFQKGQHFEQEMYVYVGTYSVII